MKAAPIPTKTRETLTRRSDGLCERCGAGGPTEVHHRRGRAVRDAHTHCPCNCVRLCRTCHAWAHSHPAVARQEGMILHRTTSEPSQHPMLGRYGNHNHFDCDGAVEVRLKGDT